MNRNWVVTRQRLLRRVKLQVNAHIGENSPDIKLFKERYEREFSGRWRVSNPDRLLEAVEKADTVLGGDFHAYSQSQRTHLRILRSLSRSKKVVLALECLCWEDQKYVEQFLQNKISEEVFLSRISWKTKWGFPWKHYRPLFEIAKKRNYPVIALNKLSRSRVSKNRDLPGSRPSTESRERFAAKILKDVRKKYSEHLIYVVFGDFHLSSQQLPKKLAKNSEKLVLIHQDSAQLYFRLAKKELENEVRVLEKKDKHFCVLTSPPWVKWQNYYFFLEGLGDASLPGQYVDWTEPVRELFQVISDELDLRMKGHDFSVYLFDDPSASTSLKKTLPRKYMKAAHLHVDLGYSFFVPKGGLFMLSDPAVNQAAGLFADYVQSRLTGRGRPLWNMPLDFVALIWVKSLCFFISKLINHRRKAAQVQSLLTNPSDEAKEVLFLILEQNVDFLRWAEGYRRRTKRFRPRRKTSYYIAAGLLGGLLGERMYALYRSGKIDSKRVVDWLAKDIEDEDFDLFFEETVKKLKFVPKWAEQQDVRL